MQTFGLIDHCWTDVNAKSETRLQACQHIPRSASQLQDSQSGRNEETQISQLFFMVEGCALPEPLTAGGELFGVR